MGFSYWFRVGMMTVALIGVLITMRELNRPKRPGPPPGLIASLFNNPTAAAVNLCPTRITRLEAGKVAIFQDGLQWVRSTDADRALLDNVAVEKWFSRHCAL